MADYIILVILALILGIAIGYIIKEKKKGVKCIGCPFAESCAKRNQSSKCSSHK